MGSSPTFDNPSEVPEKLGFSGVWRVFNTSPRAESSASDCLKESPKIAGCGPRNGPREFWPFVASRAGGFAPSVPVAGSMSTFTLDGLEASAMVGNVHGGGKILEPA